MLVVAICEKINSPGFAVCFLWIFSSWDFEVVGGKGKKSLENVGVAGEHSIMEMIPSDLRSEGK